MSEFVESTGEEIRPAHNSSREWTPPLSSLINTVLVSTEIDTEDFAPHAPATDTPTGASPRRGTVSLPPVSAQPANVSAQPAKQTVALPAEDTEKATLLPGVVSMSLMIQRRRRTSLTTEPDNMALTAQSQEIYTITVMTGGQSGAGNTLAGTDANVYICLIGENVGYRTGDIWLNSKNLSSNKQNIFEDGSRAGRKR